MAPKKANNNSSSELPKSVKYPQEFEPLSSFFDKKLRNLEKRKSKLDSYKELERDGKLVDAGQIQAVAKYEEVTVSIELITALQQELVPVISEINTNIDKTKAAKQVKEVKPKQSEPKPKSVIKSLLDLQDIFELLGQDSVRSDFLKGHDAKVVLNDDIIASIDSTYCLSKASRISEEGQYVAAEEYEKTLDLAAETMVKLVTLDEASIPDTDFKFSDVMKTCKKVGESSYFSPENRRTNELKETLTVAEVESAPEENNKVERQPEPTYNEKPVTVEANNNFDKRRTGPEILNSMQGRAVKFVQDDVRTDSDVIDPAVLMAQPHPTHLNAFDNVPMKNSLYSSQFTQNMDSFPVTTNGNGVGAGHYFNGDNHSFNNANNVQPLVNHESAVDKSKDAPNGFPIQSSWADDKNDTFEAQLNAGESNFVEVKSSQKQGGYNRAAGGGRPDYQRGGRSDFRGNRNPNFGGGAHQNNNRGFNKPYRGNNNYQEESGFRRENYRGGARPYNSGRPEGFRGQNGGGARSNRGGSFGQPRE